MCIAGSQFSFTLKFCFSKWSEMQQKPGDSTALIFNTIPRTPLLFYKSQYNVVKVEYTVSQTTRATNDDWPWTLWDMRDRVTEAIDPEADIPVHTEYGRGGQLGTLQNPPPVQKGTPIDA